MQKQTPPLQPLLTAAEAAELFNISPKSLEKWRCVGGGPHFIRIGRLIRYRADDLADFIDRNVRVSTSDQRSFASSHR